jgi:glutaconate CoA-transferase, subunit B
MKQDGMTLDYTPIEQMIVSASRQVKDNDVIYVGTGIPLLAVYLAKYMHAPKCVVIFEVGIIRTNSCELQRSVDSLQSQTMSDSLSGLFYVNALAQRGFIGLGFIGAGQVDRYGNVNDTIAGSFSKPAHYWRGSGGANDVMSFCNKTIIMVRQSKRRFPEKVDYVTCPGYLDGKPGQREQSGLMRNTGPSLVITNLGVYTFEDREMVLKSYHAGAGLTLARVKAEIGWDIRVSPNLEETEPPTAEEIKLLREKVDPDHRFTGRKTVASREDADSGSQI